jgi:hypothetical protein
VEEPRHGGWQAFLLTDQTCTVVKLLVWGDATGTVRDCLQAGRLVAARDLEWRPASAPGLPALYLRESSSLTGGPREEGPARALASLRAALARPGSRILTRAAETLAVRSTPRRQPPVRQAAPALATITTPPAATAWGATALASQKERNKERLAAIDSYSQQVARWRPAASPAPANASPHQPASKQPAKASDSQEMEELASRVMDDMDV